MDRSIVFSGELPQSADFLFAQVAAMKSVGMLVRAAIGTATMADGLSVMQTTVPSMSVTVGSGSIMASSVVDASAYGTLAADAATPLMKMGINLAAANLGPFTAPATSGQSVAILIQAAFSEVDSGSVVLPYFNAGNTALPFNGPANTGAAQNTRRLQTVTLGAKVGTPATSGGQTVPAPDSGFIGLAYVTIANGATSIVSANITGYTAPFLLAKLGNFVGAGGSLADSSNALATSGWVQSLFGGSNLSNPGYQRLPGGLIVQWGSGTTSTGNQDSVAFPIAFPAGVFIVQANERNASGWGSGPSPTVYGVSNKTASGFKISGVTFTSGTPAYTAIAYDWLALGH